MYASMSRCGAVGTLRQRLVEQQQTALPRAITKNTASICVHVLSGVLRALSTPGVMGAQQVVSHPVAVN
jgi:hypothetical protein